MEILDNRFQSVADIFFRLTSEQGGGGASLALYENGEKKLDIWAGESRPGEKWGRDTYNTVFSSTKGILSVLAHRAVEQGLIDLDEKVATYWPEFGCNGKEEITIAMVLRHRAGLRAPEVDLTLDDILNVTRVEDAFARQHPIWEPDSGYAYHALSIGHLMGKILFNVTGKRIGQLLQDEIATPLHAPMWIGVPAEAKVDIADLISDGGWSDTDPEINTAAYWDKRASTYGNALTARFDSFDGGFNDPRVRAAELAGAGGITNARSLAKMYSATVVETEGVRLLSDETVFNAISRPNPGRNIYGDPEPYPIHSLGFIIGNPSHSPALSARTFGHDGFGGQQAFADLDARIGFGYTTNWSPFKEDFFLRQRLITAELVKVLKS